MSTADAYADVLETFFGADVTPPVPTVIAFCEPIIPPHIVADRVDSDDGFIEYHFADGSILAINVDGWMTEQT